MSKKLLRLPVVMDRTSLARSTIFNYVKCGRFPQPIRVSPRIIAWSSEEIDQWIDERIIASHEEVSL